jgi:Domain of unknown function (DUF6268)
MKKIISLCFLIILLYPSSSLVAQPYLDLGQVTYWTSPGDNGDPKKFNQLRAHFNLPIINKKDSSVFLINPIWEERWIQAYDTSRNVNLKGLITWFTYTRNLGKKWSLMVAAIPRWVGEPSVQFSEGFQMGGAFLLTRKFRPGFQLKAGMYYNKEFFGNFFLPLVGIDWQINKKMNLFGILPGNLTFEHRVMDRVAWGGAFRTFTNSYRLVEGSLTGFDNFIRINDIQLGIYSDVYLTKKIVLNLEAGHTLFREFSSAVEGEKGKDNLNVLADKDNFYFKASLQYRLRFR